MRCFIMTIKLVANVWQWEEDGKMYGQHPKEEVCVCAHERRGQLVKYLLHKES